MIRRLRELPLSIVGSLALLVVFLIACHASFSSSALAQQQEAESTEPELADIDSSLAPLDEPNDEVDKEPWNETDQEEPWDAEEEEQEDEWPDEEEDWEDEDEDEDTSQWSLDWAQQRERLAESKLATLAYVLEVMVQNSEPEESVETLRELLKQTNDRVLQRVIQLHLVELHAELENPSHLRQQLMELCR